jgi:hypothetical protein
VTPTEYVTKLQAYFGDEKNGYSEEQAAEIIRWARRHYNVLDKIYRSLVAKQDWRGRLPLVSKMNERMQDLGLASGAAPIPEEHPEVCNYCGNEKLEDQREVILCRRCKSMWLWMPDGHWRFAKSQQALLDPTRQNL